MGANRTVVAAIACGWLTAGPMACGDERAPPASVDAGLGANAQAAAGLAPAPGAELLVTELLALPVGRPAGRQWLELYNAGSVPLALDGAELELGSPWLMRTTVLTGVAPLLPGAHLLLGDGDPAARRAVAGWPVDVTFGALLLAAPTGEVRLRRAGRTLVELRYGPGTQLPVPQVGRALAREVGAGGEVRWCSATGPTYDGFDHGSPGGPNPGCWLCQGASGWRRQRLAAPRTLLLEAVQADPPGRDRGREWLRLRSTAQAPLDLHGLQLWADVAGRPRRSWRLQVDGCTPLAPGERQVLPVGVEPRRPAPPPPYWVGPSLPNRPMSLTLVAADGAVVDQLDVPYLPHNAGTCRWPAANVP